MIKRLTANFSIYCIADILTKGAGFLLLPIYTRLLSPEDYGILAVVSAIAAIALPVMTLGARGSIHRFFFKYNGFDRRKFYGSLWLFFLLVPGIIILLCDLIMPKLLHGTLLNVGYHPYISLALWTSYINIVTITFIQLIARASEKALHSSVLALTHFLLSTFLTIIIVLYLVGGAKGVLWARAAGTAITGGIAVFFILRYVKLNLNFSYWRIAIGYSAPLTVHFISREVLDISDRLVLRHYTSFDQVGIYNIGYLIGSSVIFISQAGYNVLLPLFGKTGKPSINTDSDSLITRSVTYYVLIVTFVVLLIVVFAKDIVLLILPASYYSAVTVIPWIAIGFFFMSIYFLPSATLSHIIGNTKWIAVGTFSMAILNLSLNIIFVPIYGVLAASITTAISYLLLFLFAFFVANRKYSFHYEYTRLFKILIVAFSIYYASSFLNEYDFFFKLFTKSLLLIIGFPLALYITGFLDTSENTKLSYVLKKISFS